MTEQANKQIEAEKPKMWGPVKALGYGLGIYFLAQTFVVLLINLYAELSGGSIQELIDEGSILLNFVGSLVLSAVTIALVYLVAKPYGAWKALKLNHFKLKTLSHLVVAILIYLFLTASFYVIVAALFPSVDLAQDQEIGFDGAKSFMEILLAFLALVVFAPISEEILFRGFVFQGLNRDFNWLVAAVVSSGLFGLAHFQLNVGIDTFALGIAACWLVVKTGSLWPAIILHAIKNGLAFILLFS